MVPYCIRYGCYTERQDPVKREELTGDPSIPDLSLLEQLVHDLILFLGIAIVLQGFGVVFHRTLALAPQGIDFSDAVIGPCVFLIALERPAEDIRGFLKPMFA